MGAAKTATAIAGGVTGGGGVTVGGAYGVHKYTIVTFEDKLKEDLGSLIQVENGDWELLKAKLKKSKDSEDDEEVKGLKAESGDDDLKNWCSFRLKDTFTSAVFVTQNKVLKRIKSYCYPSIRDKLGGKEVTDSGGFTGNFEKLKTYENGSGKPRIDATHELHDVKTYATKSAKDLQDWCFKAYSFIHRSKMDPEGINLKLSEIFCVKNSSVTV